MNKKQPTQKREWIVAIRLTADEMAKLRRDAEKAKQVVAVYAREAALGARRVG